MIIFARGRIRFNIFVHSIPFKSGSLISINVKSGDKRGIPASAPEALEKLPANMKFSADCRISLRQRHMFTSSSTTATRIRGVLFMVFNTAHPPNVAPTFFREADLHSYRAYTTARE